MPSGRRPRASGRDAWARQRLRVVDADIDPQARVSELSIAQSTARRAGTCARARLVRAPARRADGVAHAEREPSGSSSGSPAITASGTAVVYVSHRLPEVMRIADRVTVLRDGELRGTFARADVTEERVLELIAGREIDRVFPPKPEPPGVAAPILLEVRGLSGPGFSDVDLVVRAGEVVGLAGIEGNGQRELLRALAGLEPVGGGSVAVAGAALRLGDPTPFDRRGSRAPARRPSPRGTRAAALGAREHHPPRAPGGRARGPHRCRCPGGDGEGSRGRARDPHAIDRDARHGPFGWQPAEGPHRAVAARRATRPARRRAVTRRRRQHARRGLPALARERGGGQGDRRALVGRARASGPVRPRPRLLARPRRPRARRVHVDRGRDRRGRRDRRHRSRGGDRSRPTSRPPPAVLPRRLRAEPRPGDAHRPARHVRDGPERALPLAIQHRDDAPARERAHPREPGAAGRHPRGRVRPVGRGADGPHRHRLLLPRDVRLDHPPASWPRSSSRSGSGSSSGS